jgi:hypothetical protein
MAVSLNNLNAAVFRRHLHDPFIVAGEAPVTLELIAVEEPPTAARVELFCLSFRGPQSPRLPQCIYRLQHPQLGQLEIFITAISADDDGIVYESVFNRLRPKSAANPGATPTA